MVEDGVMESLLQSLINHTPIRLLEEPASQRAHIEFVPRLNGFVPDLAPGTAIRPDLR